MGTRRMSPQGGLIAFGAVLIGFAAGSGLSSALDVGLMILGVLLVFLSLAWVLRDREHQR